MPVTNLPIKFEPTFGSTLGGGIDNTGKPIPEYGDMIQSIILQILEADQGSYWITKLAAIDGSMTQANGANVVSFEQNFRSIYGLTYDEVKGANVQHSQRTKMSFMIEHILPYKFEFEDIAINQIGNFGAQLATLLQTATQNFMENINAFFLDGLSDSCMAFAITTEGAYGTVPSILATGVNRGEEAQVKPSDMIALMETIKLMQIDIQTLWSGTTKGVNAKDITLVVSPKFLIALQTYFTVAYGSTTPKEAVTRFGGFDIYGMSVVVDYSLGLLFSKPASATTTDVGTALNRDRDFHFQYTQGFLLVKSTFGMAINFKSAQTVINPDTGNTRFLSKSLFSTPCKLRDSLAVIFRPAITIDEQITVSIGRMRTDATTGLTDTWQLGQQLILPTPPTPAAKENYLKFIKNSNSAAHKWNYKQYMKANHPLEYFWENLVDLLGNLAKIKKIANLKANNIIKSRAQTLLNFFITDEAQAVYSTIRFDETPAKLAFIESQLQRIFESYKANLEATKCKKAVK